MTHSWVRARFRLYQSTNTSGVPPWPLLVQVSLLKLKVSTVLCMQVILPWNVLRAEQDLQKCVQKSSSSAPLLRIHDQVQRCFRLRICGRRGQSCIIHEVYAWICCRRIPALLFHDVTEGRGSRCPYVPYFFLQPSAQSINVTQSGSMIMCLCGSNNYEFIHKNINTLPIHKLYLNQLHVSVLP